MNCIIRFTIGLHVQEICLGVPVKNNDAKKHKCKENIRYGNYKNKHEIKMETNMHTECCVDQYKCTLCTLHTVQMKRLTGL